MSEVNTLNFLFGTDAREYFKFLEVNSETGKFKILLQKYWLCAQIGLLYGEKSDPGIEKGGWVTDTIAPPLKSEAHNIRALLFYRFLSDETFDISDEKEMLEAMNAFFSDETDHKLKSRAVRVMDDYAQGGFEKISSTIKNPIDLASFLIDYTDLLIKGKDSTS